MANRASILSPIDPVGSSLASDRTCSAGALVLRLRRPGAFFSSLNLPAVGFDQARQRLSAPAGAFINLRDRPCRQAADLAFVPVRVRASSVSLVEGC